MTKSSWFPVPSNTTKNFPPAEKKISFSQKSRKGVGGIITQETGEVLVLYRRWKPFAATHYFYRIFFAHPK